MSLYDIAVTTGLSRNTVSAYVKDMYTKNIMVGPHLRMNPCLNYKEYVHLLKFTDPWLVFRGLNQFPHVLYHGMTFGDWNTLVITDMLLDFSQLKGFQTVVHQGIRGYSLTPKVAYTTWDTCFKAVNEHIVVFTPRTEYSNQQLTPLLWGKDEWKLFYSFKYNMRKTVTPLLKKINVRYETYAKWMETLHNHCSIHTGFYPEGYKNYLSHCFLVSSDYRSLLQPLFSLLPATPFIMEVGDQLLIFVNVPSPQITNLFCTIYHMKVKKIITTFSQAVVIFHYQHQIHFMMQTIP